MYGCPDYAIKSVAPAVIADGVREETILVKNNYNEN